mmetsp:Transcript_49528/g.78422  ORF Transcript_49528/g.78422 Transcript_49528/m.78422 type:complete len:219 (-) Transcript_49528:508-1164(-)
MPPDPTCLPFTAATTTASGSPLRDQISGDARAVTWSSQFCSSSSNETHKRSTRKPASKSHSSTIPPVPASNKPEWQTPGSTFGGKNVGSRLYGENESIAKSSVSGPPKSSTASKITGPASLHENGAGKRFVNLTCSSSLEHSESSCVATPAFGAEDNKGAKAAANNGNCNLTSSRCDNNLRVFGAAATALTNSGPYATSTMADKSARQGGNICATPSS